MTQHRPFVKVRPPPVRYDLSMDSVAWEPQATLDGDRRESRPLSSEEMGYAEQVARRLVAELRTLVATLPEHAQGASGMARHLGVVRNTCQRIVSCLADPPTPDTLARLPGIQGLRLFLEAMRKGGADSADVDAAEAATEQFETLLRELAGSQTKLASRLEASRALADGDADPEEARRRYRAHLFAAASNITGRRCESFLSIYAFRPAPDDPRRMERLLVSGVIGQVARPDAIPMVLSSGNTRYEPETGERAPFSSIDRSEAHGRTPKAVLDDFSTTPLPIVTSRGARGQLIQIVDPKVLAGGPPIDVVTANRSAGTTPRPELERPAELSVWKLCNIASRHLIFDVYLHREMASSCIPSIDAQLWQPNLDSPLEDRWLTRLPDVPRLEMLGSEVDRVGAAAYPRMVELTRHLFETTGWNFADFVGYRCSVAYPVWRAGYCMTFDFAGHEME